MQATERVEQLVAPLLRDEGFELVDVELSGGVLRVSVDRDGGVDLDAVGRASQLVSDAIDDAEAGGPEIVPGRYTLEVSSPGLERPLRTPDHFRRFIGTIVHVRTKPGVEGDRRVEGPLESADDEAIVVAGRRIPLSDLERARTVFVWGGADAPAKKKPAGKKPAEKKAASR